MRLDNHIQSPRSYKAVGTRESEMEAGHDFSDANCGGARDTDAAVNKRCCRGFLASSYVEVSMRVTFNTVSEGRMDSLGNR